MGSFMFWFFVILSAIGGGIILGFLILFFEKLGEGKRTKERKQRLSQPSESSFKNLASAIVGEPEIDLELEQAFQKRGPSIEEPTVREGTLHQSPSPQAEKLPVAQEQLGGELPYEKRPAPDRTLYLAPDFELSEVKTILEKWQPEFKEVEPDGNSLARWVSSDGSTAIDMIRDEEGNLCLEIRGPKAQDFAEFLSDDLPIFNPHSERQLDLQ